MATGSGSRSVLGSSDEVLAFAASVGGSRSVLGSSDEVLGFVASGGGSRSVLGSSDALLELECGLCTKEGNHMEAKNFCPECKTYLCGSCTDTHGRFPTLRNHKTVSTEDIYKKICGLCNADGKKKEARCFCKNCDAWICYDCRKSHEKFRGLRNHTIVSRNAMFHSDSRAPYDISVGLGQLSTTHSAADSSQDHNSKTKQQNNGKSRKSYSSAKSSKVAVTPRSSTKHSTDPQTVQHYSSNILLISKVKKINGIDIKVSGDGSSCQINSCCFMPGGELVLSDKGNNKIKLLDRSLSVVDSLHIPGAPWDVAVVDNNNIIVTMPWQKQLQFIHVLPSLKKICTVNVDAHCRGVAVAAGKIIVSCFKPFIQDSCELRFFDVEGRDLGTRLGNHPDGSNMFRRSEYVAVSRSGDKIFASDWETHTVTCLTSGGKIVYQYRDDELKAPSGLFVDDNDNVIVCGDCGSRSIVQVIAAAGKKHNTMLSSVKDGIFNPRCVGFRPNDGTLAFGCSLSDILLVYKM